MELEPTALEIYCADLVLEPLLQEFGYLITYPWSRSNALSSRLDLSDNIINLASRKPGTLGQVFVHELSLDEAFRSGRLEPDFIGQSQPDHVGQLRIHLHS